MRKRSFFLPDLLPSLVLRANARPVGTMPALTRRASARLANSLGQAPTNLKHLCFRPRVAAHREA
jgi:hypothetical protein